MGAGQSNTAEGASAPSTQEVKTSYYELLAVDRNATEDELKKAYRKKALELHPDRNYGNVDHTTKLFAEVQSAYEVLSDPQERAWYDSHEAAILRGDDGQGQGQSDGHGEQYEYNTRVTSADDLVRVMSKWNKNVEFTDAPSGFYGYLREMFEQLVKEEEIAADWEKVDIPEYPPFGHADDEYDDVVKHFYQVWIGFSTRKTFAWKDKYRLSEAPDRQYRRLMEKENKKLREEGQREFNDAVRALVAFVRKRDPRYTPNTQSEADRQKALRDAASAQAAKARAANAAKLQQEVPAWVMTPERDEHEGEIDESESDEEHYECVACKKTFKSEKQWDAHEKSKKHQKAVYALRKKMQKDNAKLNLGDKSGSGVNTPLTDEYELEEEDQIPAEIDSDVEVTEQLHHISVQDDETSQLAGDEDRSDDEAKTQPTSTHTNVDTTSKAPPTPESDHEISDEDEDDEYASPEAVKARLSSRLDVDTPQPTTSHPSPGTSTPANDNDDNDSANDTPTTQQSKKLGAAAKKRLKKAAAAASAVEDAPDAKFSCAVCNATFSSKTKMHQHIKDFDHAAPKTGMSGGGVGGKNKKKGKR